MALSGSGPGVCLPLLSSGAERKTSVTQGVISLGAFPNHVRDIFLSPCPLECAVGQLRECPREEMQP